jgi:hypothetical protein
MVEDLVQWLRVQLDADDRIARRAGDSFRQIGETGVIVATEGDRAEECASANWAGIAEHIVTHDPARVLREVDAKRQVIAKYATAVDRMKELGSQIERLKADGRDTLMPEMDRATAIHRRDVLAEVLRLHALTYVDRPGYREEWRP